MLFCGILVTFYFRLKNLSEYEKSIIKLMQKPVYTSKIVTIFGLVIFILLMNVRCKQLPTGEYNFNPDWEFVKNADTMIIPSLFRKSNTVIKGWEKVSLPYTANIEPLVNEGFQWQGFCFYRKFFEIPFSIRDKHIAINFEAAMQIADIYLNGEYLFTHKGGYLPFYVDITGKFKAGRGNCILIRLNNKDNPIIPPGSSIKKNGYPYYSGIYRNVQLLVKDKIHITDPVFADRVAGGGIYVSFSNVSEENAIVNVKTDIQNDCKINENISNHVKLKDANGKIVASDSTGEIEIARDKFQMLNSALKVSKPELWSPDNPYLHTLEIKVLKRVKIIDNQDSQIGIRTFSISSRDGFVLNGKRIILHGTNRHDEYPYIGMALSDNAHYRDAWRIKHADFNFVRTSHYPQSNSFLKACDELGIMVIDPIPGFQFFGNDEFQNNSIRNVRDMIRRDRNHPSIVLWEASLNETEMSKEELYPSISKRNSDTCTMPRHALDNILQLFIGANA
jgi:beta-galactosidase